MIKFDSCEIKEKLVSVADFIVDTFGSIDMLIDEEGSDINISTILSFVKELGNRDNFDINDEFGNVFICNDSNVTLHLDRTDDEEIYEIITLQSLFEIIDEYKSITAMTNEKCITPDYAFYVISAEHDDFVMQQIFHDYNGFQNDQLIFESNFNGQIVTCSIVCGITLFGMKILESHEYNEYFPPVSCRDFFIKIHGKSLNINEYDEIANAYIFEQSASEVIDISLSCRPPYPYDDEIDDFLLQAEYMRPLLFGKGMKELIGIYNNGLRTIDDNQKIIEFTKVIEYVSQTVIRQEKTEQIQCKLSGLKAMIADADFIRDLELSYDDLKTRFSKDSDFIKATVYRCCDIEELIDLAPAFLKKLCGMRTTLSKQKADRKGIISAVKDELSQSISDTRNEISHAKANYTLRGMECPEDDKYAFVRMLRVVAVQTIRWYSNVHESQRITANTVK